MQRGTSKDCVLPAASGCSTSIIHNTARTGPDIALLQRPPGAAIAHAEMLPAGNAAAAQCLAYLEELLRQQLATPSPDVVRLRCGAAHQCVCRSGRAASPRHHPRPLPSTSLRLQHRPGPGGDVSDAQGCHQAAVAARPALGSRPAGGGFRCVCRRPGGAGGLPGGLPLPRGKGQGRGRLGVEQADQGLLKGSAACAGE